MNELLTISQTGERLEKGSTVNEQAAIDQVLALLYGQWRNLSTRLAPACFVKLDREQLRNGPVGRDLQRLATVARGEELPEPEAIATAIESILQLLFWPAGARSYAVPDSFWQTDLGRILERAKTRAAVATEIDPIPDPFEPDIADRLASYDHGDEQPMDRRSD